MIFVLKQRYQTPLTQPVLLGMTVVAGNGMAGIVTGIYAPPDDGIGGVFIEVTCEYG